MTTTRHFQVRAWLDGTNDLSVEIKPTAGEEDAVVSVRAKGRRTVYTGLLSELALILVARHAKQIAASHGIAVPRARRR